MLLTLIVGLSVGFLPSIIWLVFWLREDPHPESAWSLLKAFCGGILAIPLAVVLQYAVVRLIGYDLGTISLETLPDEWLLLVVLAWAFIEEALKFFICLKVSLGQTEDDEPIDPTIYLITAALGFAAVENALFILSPLIDGDGLGAALALNSRFIGATLVHVLSSGIIGVTIGFFFYKKLFTRSIAAVVGLILATALHSAFNLLIIRGNESAGTAFLVLWIMIMILIILIERLKKIIKK